jgi:hypothetical protein
LTFAAKVDPRRIASRGLLPREGRCLTDSATRRSRRVECTIAKKISADARRELVEAIGERYRAGSKQDKARILDDFAAVTGFHRKHSIRVLKHVASSIACSRRSSGRSSTTDTFGTMTACGVRKSPRQRAPRRKRRSRPRTRSRITSGLRHRRLPVRREHERALARIDRQRRLIQLIRQSR